MTHMLPLVVDLDGTLIQTDMLYESALQLLRDAPIAGFGCAMAIAER